MALGSFIFLSIHLGFTRAFAGKSPALIKKLLCVSDKISYDVYLVHQFMILGPMSLMTLTAHAWLNVVIISVLIIALAFLVNYLALCVRKLFSKKQGAQP